MGLTMNDDSFTLDLPENIEKMKMITKVPDLTRQLKCQLCDKEFNMF